jgi:hypothetical protein
VSITGLTVDFGMAPLEFGERLGGNILNEGTLTLKQVAVNNGNATLGGGVMNKGTLTVVDSWFYGNEAESGAAIANLGTLTLKGTTEITTSFGTYGGGIWSRGDVTISGAVAIHDNEVDGMGGGVYMGADPGGQPTLRMSGTSTVRDNTAALGGGIYLDGAKAILDDSATVRTNQAVTGGGVYLGYGRLTLNDKASVRGNRASEAAGGIETLAQLGKVSIKMTGRSSVKGNVSSLQSAAIRLTGSLLMEDNAVIRDNVDQGGFAAITTLAVPNRPVTLTMRDNSRVTSHELAPGGAALWKRTGCGTTTFVGVKTRVVGNTPKNIKSSVADC